MHFIARLRPLIALATYLLINQTWAYTYDSSLADLTTGTTNGVESRTDGTVVEYNIPIEDWPDSLVLKLQGGDGGRAKAEADIGDDQAADGGGGAVVDIEFAVSTTDANALKPGGKLRFVVGSRGESKTRGEVAGAGGGGGTGVLYLSPEADSDWELLTIAGGGGGAASSSAAFDTFAHSGMNGNTGTSGDDSTASGGENGNAGGSVTNASGGGGGWFADGGDSQDGEAGQYSGGAGGSRIDSGANGGFGCGGGGAGWALLNANNSNCGGGGAGGYSGGGAGADDGGTNSRGGGGGSYVADWAMSSSITTRDGGQNNGYVQVVTFTANSDNGMPFPTIILTGDSDYQLDSGESYSDPGASATDVYGVELTVEIDIPTDLQNGVVGDYIVLYSASDQFGGNTSAIRNVNVPYTPPTFELLGDVELLQAEGAQSISNFAYNFADVDGQSLDSYQISTNNNSLFSAGPSIDTNGTLTFTADNSATGTARVSVRAIDNPDDTDYGISEALTFNITINAANKPTFELTDDVTVLQGAGAQTTSGFAFNFADADGQTLDYYTVTNDNNDLFSAQPSIATDGTLTFTANDGSWGSATVSVVATDNPDDPDNGTSNALTFTITVTGATPPTFDLTGDITVDEDAGAQSVSNFASNFSANDSDQSLVEYQVSNNNSDLFSVEPAIDNNGTLTFTSADDASGSATVSVIAVDDANIGENGVSETQAFTITVNSVDDLPTDLSITTYLLYTGDVGAVAKIFAENPIGGNVEGVDLFYDIVGGADADFFYLEDISNNSFAINLVNNVAFDYDNPTDADGDNGYEVTVSVSNSEGSISETFTIYVLENNEAPTRLILSNHQVEDGETFVGTLTGTDPNEADTLTYSIIGGADANLFTVDEATGEVSFLSAADVENPLDNNTDNNYRVRFEVSDGLLEYDELFIIEVVAASVETKSPLFIPAALTGPEYDLEMQIGSTEFTTGVSTTTYGYNGEYLGPTLIMSQGDEVTLNVTNNLGESTTTHWHGMHVAPENDGGPHSIIANGETWSPSFTVLDTASTMWYHPHLHETTTEHVTYGLAGMILVRDSIESAVGLPISYGVDEFPIILQDRSFAPNGEFNIAPLGDTMIVNGTVDPYLEVPAQMVRFRVLNGSNSRAYNLGLSDNSSFSIVGADGGLLEAPTSVNRVVLMPGERIDIVVDFGFDQGSTLQLMSYGSELSSSLPGVGGPPNDLNGADFNLVELRVVAATANPVTTLPTSIWTIDRPLEGEESVTRTLQMTGGGPGNPFSLDNQDFDHHRIDQTILLDAVEIWELENTTGAAHPFHIHDVQFFILDRNGNSPEAWESGKKDTVLVDANDTVRFIAVFENHANEHIPYMYHCHILPHEDAGMMGQFIVVDPTDELLELTIDGSDIELKWSFYLQDFTLQSSDDLSTEFTDVEDSPTVTDGMNELSLPMGSDRAFFQLSMP